MEQKQTIIVCPKCKGFGQVIKMNKDGTPYVVRGNPVTELCDYCNGEHVVVERTTKEHFLITPAVVEEEQKKGGFFERWKNKE